MKISLNLVIFNEPLSIVERCLRSVEDIVDEKIFLVHEQYSHLEDLKKFKPDKLLIRNLSGTVVEEWRNLLIDQSSGDWILVLDPDEYLDHEAQRSILEIKNGLSLMAKDPEYVGVVFPRKNYERTKDGNYAYMVNYPDLQLRFFKRGEVYWTGKVHEMPRLKDPSKKLIRAVRGHIIHNKFHETMNEWWRKFELYRSKEVKQ